MINYRDKLERSVSLIPAAAALSAEDRAALVKALETLVGQQSDKLVSPELKKRIEVLREIQGQHKDLETKFFEERAALKSKQKRYQEQGHGFRLYTMKNNEVLAKEITECDEEALKDLEDINWCRIGNSNAFKMEFIFYPNPYFENSVLIKTYHMTNDNKLILEKAIGTEIKWYPGKILMQRDYDICSTIRDEIIPQWHQVNGEKNSSTSYNYGGHEELLKTIFLVERAVLEVKYQKLYEPLYTKIINGTTEVQVTKNETAVDQEGDKAREEKGVPYFWLTAMKNDEVLAHKITNFDEGALKYLKDIKWCRIGNSKGFKLEFFFDPNPYFKNTVLTKAYHMNSDGQPMLEEAIGMEIQWCPGKRLTENCHSFFNFFEPLLVLDDDNTAEEVQSRMQWDYDIFSSIRDNIIPPGHQQKKSKGLLAPCDFRKLEKQLEMLFLRERAALEAKYQKLYEPLYTKRYEIVNSIIEVRGGQKDAATDPNEDKATKEKGVPYFWFTAMKNDEVLAQEITENGEDALKYLKDIKWSRINNAEGFTLEFLFDPNLYFENSVLTKTYRVTLEYGNHLMVKKAIGTKIKWHPGKSLMNTLLKKKPRKRSKNAKSMTNTGHRQSFFKFFNPFHPPELPYMPCHEDGSHDMYKDLEQEFECWVELDYAIGKIIQDRVIPHAISLFSGEAVEQGAQYKDLDNDGDLYDDDNGDDNNDNGDDEDDDNGDDNNDNGDDEDDDNDGDLDDDDDDDDE